MGRRTLLLGVTGVAAGACKAPVRSRYLLTVTTADGISVVDDTGRVVRGPRAVSAATPDWGRTVSASPAGPDTRVAVEDRRSEPAVVRFDLSRGVRTGQVRTPGLYVLKQVSDA